MTADLLEKRNTIDADPGEKDTGWWIPRECAARNEAAQEVSVGQANGA